jgi:prevent-host-death family protein
MAAVNIYEAKTQLSKLIKRVRAGQEIIIADAGTPVAKLVPIAAPKAPRVLGADRGKVRFTPDAFDPLTPQQIAEWHGALFPRARPKKASARPRRTRPRRVQRR